MFRDEVITQNRGEVAGDVCIAVPVSWQSIGYLFFGAIAAVILFLSLATYSRVETVSGTIAPDKGVSVILPSRSGTLSSLAVREGQRVSAGDLLAQVRTEEDSSQAQSIGEMIELGIARQDASLVSEITATDAAARAQQHLLAERRAGLSSEITQIQAQIEIQRRLIDMAEQDLSRAQQLAGQGFISRRDLQVREEALFGRQQGLSQLNQSLSSKRAALAETERSSVQVAAQARAQAANLAATRAQIGQQAASTTGARSYAIRAPIAGTVSTLTARIGQPTDPQTPLMVIIPAGAELQAELTVASSAIGFVKEGQEVSLAIDAFPYQRFGTLKGEVLVVAKGAVSQKDRNGASAPAYPVTVKLMDASIDAFGRREPLMPGMTLSARIVTEKQSLIEWLFEPLYAVRQR